MSIPTVSYFSIILATNILLPTPSVLIAIALSPSSTKAAKCPLSVIMFLYSSVGCNFEANLDTVNASRSMSTPDSEYVTIKYTLLIIFF